MRIVNHMWANALDVRLIYTISVNGYKLYHAGFVYAI